ncbi:hypothetical protein D3C87_1789250 [compost metagenome]
MGELKQLRRSLDAGRKAQFPGIEHPFGHPDEEIGLPQHARQQVEVLHHDVRDAFRIEAPIEDDVEYPAVRRFHVASQHV